ncbi:MAG: quinolinate synthase NadA [Peptococcaceae bacterium]|jgi:quinolinate synthase|nr:quinolinate synthase NadA [Peptococcaceae bacterium]
MVREMREYQGLSENELNERITQVRQAFGRRLVILAHHYQKDEVIRHSDFRGDSLKLAQIAAQEKDAEFIVFCGVYFMAETADLLTSPCQKVILPDLQAGCPMADMAKPEGVAACWELLREAYGDRFVPVAYINSNADIKAFCGREGGMICTSANAERVFERVLTPEKSLVFLPDEHLGRNTGLRLGLRPDEILVWNYRNPDTNILPKQPPRLIVWQGFCCVHQRFRPEQIRSVREQIPGVRVIVHPECPREIVALADDAGSTGYIIQQVTDAPLGSAWAIGTEGNLIHRLVAAHPGKTIRSLNPYLSYCRNMNRLREHVLLWALENLQAGNVVNQVQVDPETAAFAALSVQRMLEM